MFNQQATLYALAAMATNAKVRIMKGRTVGKSPRFTAEYAAKAVEIQQWNDRVDAAKRDKNWGGSRAARLPKKRMLPAPSQRGATTVGDLIFNYQVHSASEMRPFTHQRAKEFNTRCKNRSAAGVKREAEHLHRVRGKLTKSVSRNIGGRTKRVIEQLVNRQNTFVDYTRASAWSCWEPIENGIWQYHLHDEYLPYFMFNDEAGELYEADPARLHFTSAEDCNTAIKLYAAWLNAHRGGRVDTMGSKAALDAAEAAFKEFCESNGRTLEAISDDEAGDENYALEG